MIDAFCHCLPPAYCEAVDRLAHTIPFMFSRARANKVMVDLEARFRVMDTFPGYTQIPSIASPTPEQVATPEDAMELATIANDAMAALVRDHPERFPAFVGTLPLNHPEAALKETDRAIRELGAAGVQIMTSVQGHPIDKPEFLAIFDRVAELSGSVWLHPTRPMTVADYPTEEVSKFDLWWALGWPHETSLAMGRLVFAGLFDRHPDLTILTHHAGGTMPMMAGRIETGLAMMGTRTPDQHAEAIQTTLKEKPLEAIKRFHADTATFGAAEGIDCGRTFFGQDRILFGTDMPFDPEQGPGYIRDTLKALETLDYDQQDLADILEGNARRALKLHP